MTSESMDEWEARQPLGTDRLPSEYLEEFSDDKLFTDDMIEKAKGFSSAYYESGEYYKDYGDLTLAKNSESSGSYDVLDTWDNAELVAKMLDEKLTGFIAQ